MPNKLVPFDPSREKFPPPMARVATIPKPYTAVSFFAGCGSSSLGYRIAGYKILFANEFIDIAADTYAANAGRSTIVDRSDIRKLTPQHVLKAIGLKRGELDLMDGSPPCFPAGTLITTADGLKPIDDVVVGDSVLTHNGRFRKVTSVMSRAYSGKLYTISTPGSTDLTSTDEHPFYARRNKGGIWNIAAKLGRREWIPAKALTEGTFVALSRDGRSEPYTWDGIRTKMVYHRITKELISYSWARTLPVDNPSFWWIAGRWVGDGWMRFVDTTPIPGVKTKPARANCYIAVDKTDNDHEYASVVRHLEACGFGHNRIIQPTADRVCFGNAEMCVFLSQFGRGAANKHIPGFVQALPIPLLKAFLSGYISADGHRIGPGHYTYASISSRLILGVAEAIRKAYGVPVKTGLAGGILGKHRTAEIQGRTVNCRPVYIGGFRTRPRGKVMYEVDARHVWVPIRNIAIASRRLKVYNISVAQDESYVANGYVVHNCKSFSTSGTRHNKWNEEVEYSEGVKQRVDDLFDEYIRLVKGIMPKVFVAENVEGLAVGKALGFLNEIIGGFEAAGYVVDSRIVDAADLGAPQQRRRLITIGVRKDIYRKLGLKAVPFPKPQRKIVTVRDVLPHIVRVRRAHSIKTRFEPSDVPANTIMASDHTVTLTAIFSSGGWIEDSSGERRKYTIPELKVLSCVPKDFKLLGEYAQQWERLGRAHLPISTYHIGKVLREQVLSRLRYEKDRKASN